MKRPQAKSIALTKVSKAVRLPGHVLTPRLRRVLQAIDAVHSPKGLRAVSVVLNRYVAGGSFDPGLYTIDLNPNGTHLELSLLHEVGHYLEWQSIPKAQPGPRDFGADPKFTDWLAAVLQTASVQRLLTLLGQQTEKSQAFNDIEYLLRPNELWTRAYSQHIASATRLPVLSQQIAAENRVVTGNMNYKPYWDWKDFEPVQRIMNTMFAELGWAK